MEPPLGQSRPPPTAETEIRAFYKRAARARLLSSTIPRETSRLQPLSPDIHRPYLSVWPAPVRRASPHRPE